MPGAFGRSLTEFQAGRIRWAITDSHSDRASDTVAEVQAARVDSRGLLVEAGWMPTPRAQELRSMVLAGARLGLSIDFVVTKSHSGADGTRYLDEVTVLGAAIVTHSANSLAMIVSGKTSGLVPVSRSRSRSPAAREHDPECERRHRQAKILAASSWPGPERVASIGVEKAFTCSTRRRRLARTMSG